MYLPAGWTPPSWKIPQKMSPIIVSLHDAIARDRTLARSSRHFSDGGSAEGPTSLHSVFPKQRRLSLFVSDGYPICFLLWACPSFRAMLRVHPLDHSPGYPSLPPLLDDTTTPSQPGTSPGFLLMRGFFPTLTTRPASYLPQSTEAHRRELARTRSSTRSS